MSITHRIRNISKSGFIRSVAVLVGGTAFAQALTVLALPLLTRLYTPEDFGVLAVYAAALSIISVIACLRFEIAIPLPEKDTDAAALLILALCSSALFGVLTAIILALWPDTITEWARLTALRPYLWLVPLGVWLASSYAAVQYWATRKKNFTDIAKTRMAQSLFSVGTQAGMGLAGITPFGLLLGQLLNSGAGIVGLFRKAWCQDQAVIRSVDYQSLKRNFREYERLPKYSVPEAFANNAAIQVPVIIIASMAIGAEAGYLLLATRLMSVPLGLIGGAISQVFLSQAPTERRGGNLGAFTAKINANLAKIGVGPLLFSGIIATSVFPLVFGNDWVRAGELLGWMTPWFIMQLLSSPISMVLHVTDNQKTAFILQIFGLILRVSMVLFATLFLPNMVSEVYAISGFLFYFFYYLVILKVSSFDFVLFFSESKKIFFIVVFWITTGFFVKYFINVFNGSHF